MAWNVPARWRNPLERLWPANIGRDRESDGRDGFWAPATLMADGMPAVDMEEDDSEIRVTAEMPGLEKEDFKVEVLGDRLVIRGEKKAEREKREAGYFYSERSYGSFSRSLQLPAEVEVEKAKAEYKNGVLKLRLPKSETAKAKQIKVSLS